MRISKAIFYAKNTTIKKIEKKILNKNGRTAVFIDASNIYHSQKHLGFQIDFKKLLNYFKKKQICHQFTFYTAYDPKHKNRNPFWIFLK